MKKKSIALLICICVLCVICTAGFAGGDELTADGGDQQYIPDVYISDISLNGNDVTTNITNNSSEVIDKITVRIITFGPEKEIYDKHLYSAKESLTTYVHISENQLFAKSSMPYYWDISHLYDNNVKYVGAFVEEYHTTGGNDYELSPDKIYFCRSDGKIVYPSTEPVPDCLSDADYTKAGTLGFGVSFSKIYPFLEELYGAPAGVFCYSIADGSILDLAGLEENDIIIAFDNIGTLEGHSFEKTKLKLLEGETVRVLFSRNGQKYTTLISADMESLLSGRGTLIEAYNEADDDKPVISSEQETDAQWFCPECGQENEGKFCTNCGTPRP